MSTKGISVQARKAKGRKLQQWVRDAILGLFHALTKDDVRSTGMGQGGADVQLSPLAMSLFPYAVECKAQEQLKGVYAIYDQATDHSNDTLEPLVILKMSRREPLALISAEHFFSLVKP